MTKPIAPDLAIGVWKLNLPRSSFRLVPMPSVLRVEAWHEGLKVRACTIDLPPKALHPAIAYRFDGNDYPLVGTPIADAISAKRINEHVSENAWKKDGEVVLKITIVVSSDSKTLSVTRTSNDAHGHTSYDVMVYDKLSPSR